MGFLDEMATKAVASASGSSNPMVSAVLQLIQNQPGGISGLPPFIAAAKSKQPPNAPSPASTALPWVERTALAISSVARAPAAISTPEDW